MKTNHLLLAAIAALALLVTFNSCKEKEEEFEFPYEEVEILVEDGTVFTSLEELASTHFSKKNVSVNITETPDYSAKSGKPTVDDWSIDGGIKPYTKYYWYLYAEDKNGKSGFSEIRSFYYVPEPHIIDIKNIEGDWAAIIKWEHNDVFEDAQVTMTPNKDCNYDKNPIKIPAGQDSCYISAGTLDNQKYQIYHSWWDEANGKYYDPVIYDFTLTINCNCSGDIIPVSTSAKGIFLNTDGYVADRDFNVYRYGKIGNRIWMLDDLRMKFDDTTLYHTVKLESGLELVLYPEEFYEYYSHQGGLLRYEDIMIPKGFHLAKHEDWLDLEAHFGVEENDNNNNWKGWGMDCQTIYKFIANAGDTNKYDYKMEYHSKTYFSYLTDYYYGKGSHIRDHLIADNEWIDFNDTTKKMNGSHIFNAHPVGIPYITDFEKMTFENPYKGYGVAFNTSSGTGMGCIQRILWSGSDGICTVETNKNWNGNERNAVYSLWRCVKD